MDIVTDQQQRKKIHPHKFTLWVSIGSIVMMFAGLTSAFIVKSNQVNWEGVTLPQFFWYSTAVMLLSSLTVQVAFRAFKQREMSKYRTFIGITVILGSLFILLQWLGFQDLYQQKITFKGAGAGQFLYVIFGLHALHVIGGVIVLIVMLYKAFFGKVKSYDPVRIDIAATYWHFVDLLWIYLMVFFLVIGSN